MLSRTYANVSSRPLVFGGIMESADVPKWFVAIFLSIPTYLLAGLAGAAVVVIVPSLWFLLKTLTPPHFFAAWRDYLVRRLHGHTVVYGFFPGQNRSG